jgi:membrane fusion protein (multidrug efflux system)
LNAISSRITGTVLHINPSVENNQHVEAGTLLVELDPNDYQAALDHAKADLAGREGMARSASVNVPITGTSAFSAERDRVRYQTLVEKREISRSDYDARETEVIAAAETLASDRAVVNSERQRIVQARSLVDETQAQVEAARTAPQQVVDARAKSQSSIGQADRARAGFSHR